MASRSLQDLREPVQEKAEKLLVLAGQHGLDILIYCTLRPAEEQARLFRQGRSLAEIQRRAQQLRELYDRPDLADVLLGVGPQTGIKIVTWSAPGQSYHQYGLAFDGVPLREGKPVWSATDAEDRTLWMKYGELVQEVGLEWAGDWSPGKREYPHAQEPGLNWRELIREDAQ